MNRKVVLFHLNEAREELEGTIERIQNKPDYGIEHYRAAMGHLYHHLNTAWNGQNQTDEQFKKCSEKDFERFLKFPKKWEFEWSEKNYKINYEENYR